MPVYSAPLRFIAVDLNHARSLQRTFWYILHTESGFKVDVDEPAEVIPVEQVLEVLRELED